MWILLGVICIFLLRITFAFEKCGLPAKPPHGQLSPDKPFYDLGDEVHVNCAKNYVFFSKETGIQTCDDGVWLGKPSVCLPNLAYGRNFARFGSPSGGQSRPHGGVFIYEVTDASEYFFFDVFLERSTKHAYAYFRGNFTVTDQNGNELPFKQIVLGFDIATNFYHVCSKSSSGDYFECIAPDERSFTGAKVEITLLNKSVDLTYNTVQIKLQIEKNGFVVASLSDKDCGTPPIPLHGSVSTTANDSTAKYTCSPGYTLYGKSAQTCDLLKFPEIQWVSRTPVCLENPQNPTTVHEDASKCSDISIIVVIAVLSTVACLVVLFMLAWKIWFCKKKQGQSQTLHPHVPMMDLLSDDGVDRYGSNNARSEKTT